MATKFFTGNALPVAQVASVQITTNDTASTYSITIGGISVSVVGNAGGAASTATDLKTACNLSVHPYFAAITWSTSTDTLIGTADVAGCPFVFTAAAAGGSGAVGSVTAVTANSGPNCWDSPDNWSDDAVPVNSDVVVLENVASKILWGLDQSAVSLASLTAKKTFTGRVGLDSKTFALTADGASNNSDYSEYRQAYLKIGATLCDLGYDDGIGSPSGSDRIMLDLGAVASTVTVHSTASSPAETGKPAVRILCNNATTDVYVREAPAGVGVGVDEAGETSSLRSIYVSSKGSSVPVVVGPTVTMALKIEMQGGRLLLQSLVPTLTVLGGSVRTEGDFTITTITQSGGEVVLNHKKSAGNAVTTYNLQGGVLDLTQSRAARTIAALALKRGASLRWELDTATITALTVGVAGEGPKTLTLD